MPRLGNSFAASAGSSRSHGIPCAAIARSDSASQPSSRWANHAMPISTISSSAGLALELRARASSRGGRSAV